MSFSSHDLLRHILDETAFLISESLEIDFEKFHYDETLKRAFSRSLEIIGEAVKKLPKEFTEMHSSIDWRSIAGTRDKLIHDYFGVDYELVWDIVKNHIPELQSDIISILEE